MNVPVHQPEAPSIQIIDASVRNCARDGCGGSIVRHSLGGAQSVYRCTRCFSRYERRAPTTEQGALKRLVQDFISWRES